MAKHPLDKRETSVRFTSALHVMPQLDFTVWGVNVVFTAIAIFVGITAYHLDSEAD